MLAKSKEAARRVRTPLVFWLAELAPRLVEAFAASNGRRSAVRRRVACATAQRKRHWPRKPRWASLTDPSIWRRPQRLRWSS